MGWGGRNKFLLLVMRIYLLHFFYLLNLFAKHDKTHSIISAFFLIWCNLSDFCY